MITRCTGPDCASPTHRDRLLRAIVGTGFISGDEMPGDCAGSDPCDEADGTIAVGHALHPRRSDLRLSELLTCAMRDLVRPARRKRRALYVQRFADAFCAMPFDARRRQLRVCRRRCIGRLVVAGRAQHSRASLNRTAPVQATSLAGRHSPQPDARADTLALLRPAALAQMARSQPFRGIAEFPDEPQDKAPDRQNDDLPRHKKQEDHPGRLMHDAAPCCR